MRKRTRMKKTGYALAFFLLIGGVCCGCGEPAETMAAAEPAAEGAAQGDGEAVEKKTGESAAAQADIVSANDAREGGSVSDNDAESVSENDVGDETVSGNAAAYLRTSGKRPAPVKVRGIYVSGPIAGAARMDDLIDLVDRTELNAMVIDIKNDEGRVTYRMQSDQVLEVESGIGYISDIDALVAKCKEKDIYLIARIVAFRDPYLAERKPEWAVHTKDGAVFRDKNGLAWVNPYCREVWDYLVEIASQAAQAGFDEVQFDYIRFSTDVRESSVDYGPESERTDKIGIITEFTKYLYERLAPQGVYVAADVFGTVIDNKTDQEIVGQDYVRMAQYLDYICPMVYPSHYYSGSYGIAVPDADPYGTIRAAATASVDQLGALPETERAKVRLWLQSFTASWVPGHISYGPEQIRAQIKGARDAGYDEWILWNAAVNYQPDAFLTDEEAAMQEQTTSVSGNQTEE